ncbi:ABC transporter permease [Luteipulveratus sp. YIM 133132]|uniref:Transport permease protein n=1 Tax=Luteipulveratus flavus TaxID=3031728 RepID=A0ABT6CCJ7_9MICO|nr:MULTISPECIES: ABC transporter permease [unclassified Luteipulveratus]MDE9364300.1 ABC transporter permease [Luteipulveratus sp. YIM 133132]MDF8266496.1 ABC transporter permease [Luteipulveratus sp. YIM 133296]
MTSSTTAEARRIVISAPGRFRLPAPRTLWEAREVLWRFGLRDITLRYRQTFLGVIWVVLQPALTAGIFTLVFGKVANLDSGGVPYFVFSFVGMTAWNVFNGVATRAAPSLVANSALVSKVFFPRVLVPLSTACSVVVDLAVSLVMAVGLLFAYGINPGWAVLTAPVWLLMLMLLGAGLGVAASALMVRYRDVGYILPFALQALLYISPIAYALSAVPAKYEIFYQVNPLSWLLQCVRWSLLGQPMPPWWQIGGSVAASVGAFLLGVLVFEQLEREFADVI